MQTNPLISILTLVHNQRSFIEQTIQSVMSQTYENWEWIILDDGSTDGTGAVIGSIGDKRIRYLFQQNRGFSHIAENFNKIFSLSRGDLIAMVEGDDYWPAYKLEVQTRRFEDPAVVFSYGECCLVNQQGEKIGYMALPEDPHIARNDPPGSSLKAFMHLANIGRYFLIHDCTVMIRRKTLVDIGGFVEPDTGHQDLPTWARLALEGRFAPIPLCLGYWRRHPMASTYNQNAVRLFDGTIDFFRGFLKDNEGRLRELGFPFAIDEIEKRWARVRERFVTYLPYNRAMTLLRLRSFKDARAEFRKFLKSRPSLKSGVTYGLIVLSDVVGIDLVTTLTEAGEQVRAMIRKTLSRSPA